MVPDVVGDGGGDEVSPDLPAPEPGPDLRRRDIQTSDGQKKDPEAREPGLVRGLALLQAPHPVPEPAAQHVPGGVEGEPGPGSDNEQAFLEDARIFPPRPDLEEGI